MHRARCPILEREGRSEIWPGLAGVLIVEYRCGVLGDTGVLWELAELLKGRILDIFHEISGHFWLRAKRFGEL